MNRENLTNQVIELVREVTKNPEISISSAQENTQSWDSLAYLVIAEELENRFGLIVNAANIDALDSIHNIVVELEKRMDR